MSDHHHDDGLHDHDRGLSEDLPRIAARGYARRGMLGLLGGIGVAAVAGCAFGDNSEGLQQRRGGAGWRALLTGRVPVAARRRMRTRP